MEMNMFLKMILWGIIMVISTASTNASNILFVIPFSSKSHYIMLSPIGLELARRGHNVTVITPVKEEKPPDNYHQVMVDDKKIWDVLEIERPNIFTTVDTLDEIFHYTILWMGGSAFTEVALNSSAVQEFLRKDNTFDLVIVEQFYQEAFYTLAYKYNAPLVLVTTFGNCMRHNIITGNPLQMATVGSEFLFLKDPTSFVGRLRNFQFTMLEYVIWRLWYIKKQEELAKKYIPDISETCPNLYELQKNYSVMLINGHFSYKTPVALLPNIIEVGGLHLSKSSKKLTYDLQMLLDKSNHGVIYMNFGSNVRSAELPIEKKNAFINAFKKLKQNILWKWEDDDFVNKSDNIYIRKWLPQKEILEHPNVKLFISHGGLIGTQEAIYNGVPVVGVPIYADQYNNLLFLQEEGYGKILQYHDISEENVYKVLNQILSNNSFLEKAKEMSRRFKDRPLPALDTAIFWLEYVIRNKGAEYIKNPARNLSWFSYNMLDVYIFVVALIVTLFLLIVKSVKFVMSFMIKGKHKME